MSKAVKAVPEGFHAVTPYLTVNDVEGDNTHLTPLGYSKMANRWAGVISDTIPGGTKRPLPPTNLHVVDAP